MADKPFSGMDAMGIFFCYGHSSIVGRYANCDGGIDTILVGLVWFGSATFIPFKGISNLYV